MVRQHVNPLCSSFQKTIDLPNWNTEFTDISLPVHIDVGCAKGNYLIKLASQNSHINYIGLEIRKPLVDQANKKVRDMKLGNITFIFCNANISFSSIYQSLYKVDSIYILNPDPWFKVRHKKRRLINEKFVEDLYKLLDNDIQIFIQTDVEDLFNDIYKLMSNYFKPIESKWIDIQSDRESSVLSRDGNIYKIIFIKD